MRLADRRYRGFTLVEIMMVVVILGIAGAVIIPQLGSRSDLVVSAAARQVMSDLMYAQNRAITNQAPVYVVFTPATGTGVGGNYTLMSALPSTPITHPISQQAWTARFGLAYSGASGGAVGAMQSVRLDTVNFDGQTAIKFDETGTPQSVPADGSGSATPLSSGSVKLTVGTQALTIKVEPVTGTLSVQ
jgi:prepilin-type N-terminal cleavage/methylation domain-containing protein